MIDVREITDMQCEATSRWHQQDIDNAYAGFLETACKQHSYNFLIWHEEDIARATDVPDSRIAEVKRNIDRYNQARNDWIEKLDDAISALLDEQGVKSGEGSPLNTETPGSVIDRLSILAIRIYHLEEQANRDDATQEHIAGVQQKLAVCFVQLEDLSLALRQLLQDIWEGRKRHRTYRQFKMYNDPSLNPYLYKAKERLARS